MIISHRDDPHADAVMQQLRDRAAPHRLLDLAGFPRNGRLVCRYGASGTALALRERDLNALDFGAVRAVWWRRPQPFGFEETVTNVAFAANECDEAITGLWHALDARWMNPPLQDGAAHRKSWQLKLAQEVGLEIPETLITNSVSAAREFIGSFGRVVYKAFSGTTEHWRETRLLGQAELQNLSLIRHAPVILQEFIPGIDYRVTVVGSRIFPAAIDAREGNYPIDFRMNREVGIRPASLTPSIEAGIQALMRRMELVYAAVDFRLDERSGEFRFLEINPAGQWLFVEQQTGQPIAEAVADKLISLALAEPPGASGPLPKGLSAAH